MLASWKKSYDQPRQHIKKQRHHFADKGLWSQSYSFSSSHVWMGELDHKESWAPKNWCFQTVVLERTLESRLVCKEIKLVNTKGNQPWIFIGRTDTEALIIWPPDTKSWLIGKDLTLGKIEGRRREWQGMMIRWQHRLKKFDFEQTPGDSEGQGGLVCCSSGDNKESDKTVAE